MKIFFTLIAILNFTISFSQQWTRAEQLPASDIFSLYHKGNTLYAGGRKVIYVSTDKGQSWDSTAPIPQLPFVDNIIVFKNDLYASSFNAAVFKSRDGGATWQNIVAGIAPSISDFVEWKDNLYAATEGNAIFKLDPVNGDNWIPFSNGLSDFSINVTTIAGTSSTLVAGTLGNGLYDYLAPGSNVWEERFLNGQINPNEGGDDMGTAHDTLFLAGRSGKFYISTNDGFTWTRFGDAMPLLSNSTINARQAFLTARNFVINGLNTVFFYQKKDSLNMQVVPFSFIANNFTYRIDIVGDKLWNASTSGLFYMSLSDLPGITSAEDTAVLIPLPLRYISFDLALNANETVSIKWQTADEFNIDHFEVERSVDGSTWTVLSAIRPQASNKYHYVDISPVTGTNYYRVKAVGTDGHFFFTNTRSIALYPRTTFRLWPNPAHDKVTIDIDANEESTAVIQMFDSKGGLILTKTALLKAGHNQASVEIGSLATGVYSVHAEWNNRQTRKTIRVIKD